MEKEKLLVGYARVDVTPEEPVPLTGYGNEEKRISVSVLDPLYGTCLAFTDERGETALVYTLDQLLVHQVYIEDLRRAVVGATGVPADRILFAATHTHASPWMFGEMDCVKRYQQLFYSRLARAGVDALADRSEARMLLGRTQTHGMNFVRHYKVADGTFCGDNFGDPTPGRVGHVAPADEQVLIARFVREGKKDVLLFNWQAHAKLATTLSTPYGREHRYFASADFITGCRRYIEMHTGCHVAYFSGASGNLNPQSDIPEENPPSLDPFLYGTRLGEMFLAGLDGLTPAKAGHVELRRSIYEAQIDHSDDHLVPQAREVLEFFKQTNNFRQSREFGKKYGIIGGYHAAAILSRAESEQKRGIELNALRVGELAFAAVSYEMFAANGQFVKQNSPYGTTFILSCCNGYHSYIADDLAFSYNSYEAYARRFVPGTAEGLTSEVLRLLGSLK